MKILLSLMLALITAVMKGQESQQDTRRTPNELAAIEGLVINSLTGKALDGVHVTLLSASSETTIAGVYGAMSTPAGRFSVMPIQPGAYLITLEKTGFVFVPVRSKAGASNNIVTLKPGQALTLKDVTLEMTPKATIAGLIFDEFGEPMEGVSVELTPVKADFPFPAEYGSSHRTNDRGEFRIGIPPGKYYIKAVPQNPSSSQPSEIRTDGTAETIYRETYYPGAAGVGQAQAIEVQAGGTLAGIRLALLHSAVLSISGNISGMPEGADSLTLTLISGNSASSSGSGPNQKPNTHFKFGPLVPGLYQVYAECLLHGEQWLSQAAEINLADASVDDLTLVLTPGFDVHGTVETVGLSSEALKRLGPRSVSLLPHGLLSTGMPQPSPVTGDGSFRIANVHSRRYRLEIAPLPDNGYIKSVRVNGYEAPDGILDLRNGGDETASLKITVSANGGTISGRVEDTRGHAHFLPAIVILAAESGAVFPDRLQRSSADRNGSYSFKALPPGRYRLLAVDPLDIGRTEFAELIKRYRPSAETIEVKEGDDIQKNLKVLTLENVEKKPKQ